MGLSCPIAYEKIDENVARMNGVLAFIVAILFIFTGLKWLAFFLLADFGLRAFKQGKLSPLCFFSKTIMKLANKEPSPTNAGPKYFAARIGFAFSLIISILVVLNYLGYQNFLFPALILAGMLSFFAFLEGFFGFCVACKIYPLVVKQ
ncbi:MAG: DUF4395 domain-containing protein [Vulcanimicrobiota bacterium]